MIQGGQQQHRRKGGKKRDIPTTYLHVECAHSDWRGGGGTVSFSTGQVMAWVKNQTAGMFAFGIGINSVGSASPNQCWAF